MAHPPLAPAGTDVTTVRMFGTTAAIVHRTNHTERNRRHTAGLSHVDSMELLDVLMDLPVGAAIPVGSIAPQDMRVLRAAPAGVVRTTAATVTRLLEPAVTPLLAVVSSACWRTGLAAASEFSAYLPRMLLTPHLPRHTDDALTDAAHYGIGVAVGPASTPTVVLAPEPLHDWQPTVAWWRFCERVYSHLSLTASDVRTRKETRGRDRDARRPRERSAT